MKLETLETILLSEEEINTLKEAMNIAELCERSVVTERNYHYSISAREAIEKLLCIVIPETDLC